MKNIGILLILIYLLSSMMYGNDLNKGLIKSVEEGNLYFVKHYFDRGADISVGKALKLAQKKGHTEIIKYLEVRQQISKDFVPKNYRIRDLTLLSRDHIIVVLQKKEMEMEDYQVGYPIILLKKNKDKYIEVSRTQTVSVGSNSAAEGFMGIVSKGDFFTIEQVFGGRVFILSYATFKYNTSTEEFLLDKYSEVYIDRYAESQDESEPTHFKVEKNKYSFEDFTEEFFDALRNDEL